MTKQEREAMVQEIAQAVAQAVAPAVAQAVAPLSARIDALEAKPAGASAGTRKGKPGNTPEKPEPVSEKVEYVKKDGSKRTCSPAQAKAWDEAKERLEEAKEQFDKAKAKYKPSKALKDAILADRARITREVAAEEFGFIGTKRDLRTLKASICK